eukprot:215332-Prymnesium_polylepis.2
MRCPRLTSTNGEAAAGGGAAAGGVGAAGYHRLSLHMSARLPCVDVVVVHAACLTYTEHTRAAPVHAATLGAWR